MMEVKLPTWDGVAKQMDDGEIIDPVEQFIYNNTPTKGRIGFRLDLQRLINYVIEEFKKKANQSINDMNVFNFEDVSKVFSLSGSLSRYDNQGKKISTKE